MLPITRYYIKDTNTAPWIKFLWSFKAEHKSAGHILLPTDALDVLFCFSGNIEYKTKSHNIKAPKIHINSLREHHCTISHSCATQVYGISFYAYGFYPFYQKNMRFLKDKIININNASPALALLLRQSARHILETDVFEQIEQALSAEIKVGEQEIHNARIIESFLSSTVSVEDYSASVGLNLKTFERLVSRYTGYTPKLLRRFRRFQTASNQLVHQPEIALTKISYDNMFSDQAHFTREFHGFAGAPPALFQQQKKSVKQNAFYTFL